MYRSNESELITKYFSYLFEQYEFAITDAKYFPESFGNWVVVLESPKCSPRFTLDRDTVLCDVGPLLEPSRSKDEKWFGLPFIIAYLEKSEVRLWYLHMTSEVEPQLAKLADILRGSINQIVDIFSLENFANHKDRIQRICDEWHKDFLNPARREKMIKKSLLYR